MQIELLCITPEKPKQYYTFHVSGVPRFILMEWCRHDDDTALSVQSTRYALKKIIDSDEEPFYLSDFEELNEINRGIVSKIKELINKKYHNDDIKYILLESLKTEFLWTAPKNTVLNFIHLRLDPHAHHIIQIAADLMYDELEKHGLLKEKDLEQKYYPCRMA